MIQSKAATELTGGDVSSGEYKSGIQGQIGAGNRFGESGWMEFSPLLCATVPLLPSRHRACHNQW